MPTPQDRAAAGRERLAARARRASNLRRRVVAGALASFVLAWGVIAFQGSMGVVPAKTSTTAATQSTSTQDTSTTGQSTTTDPVTTSQS